MDTLSKAAPCRMQKDLLHKMLNQRAHTKQRPQWDDTSRGMFIALLRQSSRTIPSRNFPVECTIDGLRTIDIAVFKVIAELMKVKEGFADMNEFMALEKWAWLCWMYSKAKNLNRAGNPIVWRYANSMDFMGDEPVNTQPFVDLLTTDSFTTLCKVYNANDNDMEVIDACNLISENYTRRKSRRSLDSVVSAIRNERNDMEPPTKVQIIEASTSDAPHTRMTTRAQARTSLAAPGMSEIKTEIKEEVKDKDEKFERAEMDEVEVDFTGSSANGPTWTKEMIDQIVVEVKKRQSYWDTAHPDYRSITKRRDAMHSIAHVINTTHGTSMSEKDISNKWNHMRGAFGKMVDHFNNTTQHPAGHFYEQMSFLLFNNHTGAGSGFNTPSPASSEERNTTPTVTITEGPSQPLNLQEIFKGISHETPTKQTLKQMMDAGLRLHSQSATVGGGGIAAMNGHHSLVVTSNGNGTRQNGNSNSSYTMKESRRMDNEISLLARTPTDSWGVFGRLVEISGREMNRVSPSLAIRMQRALHQVLHDFRLEGANSGLQL
uniref:MADF domain-containing protein n=1 Tax=Pristionchus pacificus TaxID=54126 RepID=A0A8R1Z747_PRIPA